MWKPAPSLELPSSMESLLTERGSMTCKMEQVTGCSCVADIKEQAWMVPSQDELQCLALEKGEPAWVREVVLSFGEPCIFARSVFPKALIESDPRFEKLDANPLGRLLFCDPATKRGEIEIAKMSQKTALWDKATACMSEPADVLWARRSVFSFHEYQLLVCEVFFPNVAML